MAYIWGSAFYGIYFIVSFPGFYYFDSHVDEELVVVRNKRRISVSLTDTITIACGHGMMILTLLDLVRLYLGIPLFIDGIAFKTTA